MPAWDFEQYTHTLIAKAVDFVPTSPQVQNFFSFLTARNVVPKPCVLTLRIPTGKLRKFPNLPPQFSENLFVEETERKSLADTTEIETNVSALGDFLLELSGTGYPKTPPLSIHSDTPYHLGVTCRVYSKCRSTSNDRAANPKTISYGRPCPESQRDGIFHNPHNGEALIIPGAGCARFWIEFELGKFLCPEFTNTSLQFLNPVIQTEAVKIFGTEFVQGCHW